MPETPVFSLSIFCPLNKLGTSYHPAIVQSCERWPELFQFQNPANHLPHTANSVLQPSQTFLTVFILLCSVLFLYPIYYALPSPNVSIKNDRRSSGGTLRQKLGPLRQWALFPATRTKKLKVPNDIQRSTDIKKLKKTNQF